MTGQGKDGNGARGFEGLGELLGDDAQAVPPSQSVARAEPERRTTAPPPDAPPANAGTAGAPGPDSPPSAPQPEATPGRTRAAPWGWIVAGGIGIWIVFASIGNHSTPSNAFRSPVTSDRSVDSPPSPPDVVPPGEPQWVEIKPPVGRDRVLSGDEIRFCRSEIVRLHAMEQEVDDTNETHIELFNQYVDDYNIRCGSFQYREGVLESVQREVDARQSWLAVEGAARIAGQSKPRVAGTAPQVAAEEPIAVEPLVDDATVDTGERVAEQWTAPAASAESDEKSSAHPAGEIEWAELTPDERESLEIVCGRDRQSYGKSAYDVCFTQQLVALAGAPRGRDLSQLSARQREDVEAACSTAKYMEGPAAMNLCVEKQFEAWEAE